MNLYEFMNMNLGIKTKSLNLHPNSPKENVQVHCIKAYGVMTKEKCE